MREHLRSTVSCDTENPKKEDDDAMTETRKSPVSFILKDTLLPWRGMLLSSAAARSISIFIFCFAAL